MTKGTKVYVELTATEVLLKIDGLVIAKRGRPDSPQAAKWIVLEPGYEVIDGSDGWSIVIHRLGVRIH